MASASGLALVKPGNDGYPTEVAADRTRAREDVEEGPPANAPLGDEGLDRWQELGLVSDQAHEELRGRRAIRSSSVTGWFESP